MENSITIQRVLTHSDIKYGIIGLNLRDGSKKFFKELPERYDIVVMGDVVHNRTTLKNKVWLGNQIMAKFNPGDIIRISKKGSVVIIEK